MYLRFVTIWLDDDSHMPAGIFTAAYLLDGDDELPDYARAMLVEILAWFDRHLVAPHTFSRSPRAYGRNIGLCWFKDTARQHVERAFELMALLEDNNIFIEVVTADRPGFVVYEDDHQIVAEPPRYVRSF